MSEPTYPYRNVTNDRVGFLTEAQAGVFPELLERVPDDAPLLAVEDHYVVAPAAPEPVAPATVEPATSKGSK